jgi:glycosyltransferase involved in cell wall biosynthesis
MSSVSVFVPAYNYARFLSACVDSVLGQTGVDVRVRIIDDCSTDETEEVGRSLAAADDRVEYARHARNLGHIATYNEGVEWADGDYTVLLSADDMLTPGALQRATALLDAHPEVSFAYGDVVRFPSGQPLPAARTTSGGRWRVQRGESWLAAVCRSGRNFVVAPEVVVRTSTHKEVGGYSPALPHSADMELWLRLAARGEVGWLSGVDQAYYRIHENNMHEVRFGAAVERLVHRRAAFDSFFAGPGGGLPNATAFRDTAARALARSALARACDAMDAGQTSIDGTSVTELVAFAGDLADLTGLREHQALRWRQRLGPQACRRLRPLVRAVTLRHPRAWLRWHLLRQRPV